MFVTQVWSRGPEQAEIVGLVSGVAIKSLPMQGAIRILQINTILSL